MTAVKDHRRDWLEFAMKLLFKYSTSEATILHTRRIRFFRVLAVAGLEPQTIHLNFYRTFLQDTEI